MQNFKKSHLENIISYTLNIGRSEWLIVFLCWLQKFAICASHVVGHTILIALFAKRIGVENLPYLFIADALLIFLATAMLTPFIERIRKEKLLVWLSALATVTLLIGWLLDPGSILFYGVLLLASSLLISQFTIISALYIEDQFSPLESQRTFPVIESAEILSALVAGLILVVVSKLHIEAKHVILLWAFFVLFSGITVAIYQYVAHRFPYLQFSQGESSHEKNMFTGLQTIMTTIRKNNFLKFLAFVVFLQIVISIILEYQYTYALNNITGGHGHGEMDLTHALSLYIVFFSGTGLILQLFIGSRVMKWFGVIRTMLLNPLLSGFAFLSMVFSFNQYSAIGSKYVFDITKIFYINAYLSSYYTVEKTIREKAKAIIEGWFMPIGTVVGTLVIIGLNIFFDSKDLYFALNSFLVLLVVLMVFFLRKLQRHYTEQSVIGLKSSDLLSTYNAIEILGERGHTSSLHHLVQALNMPRQEKEVKIKILETLGRLKNIHSVSDILDCLEDEDNEVKIAAVKALGSFGKEMEKEFYSQAFTYHRIIAQLEHVFFTEKSHELKSEIIKVLAYLHEKETVVLLLKVLNSDDDMLVADAMHVIGHQFDDLNIAYYIRDHLKSESTRVKANAIIALWQFKQYRLKLLVEIVQLLAKKDIESIKSTIYMLGELNSKQEQKKLEEYLHHQEVDIRRYAAIALAKLGVEECINVILECVFNEDNETARKMLSMLNEVKTDIKNKVERLIQQEASHRIHVILAPVNARPEKLRKEDIEKLIFLYDIIGTREEVMQLQKFKSGSVLFSK